MSSKHVFALVFSDRFVLCCPLLSHLPNRNFGLPARTLSRSHILATAGVMNARKRSLGSALQKVDLFVLFRLIDDYEATHGKGYFSCQLVYADLIVVPSVHAYNFFQLKLNRVKRVEILLLGLSRALGGLSRRGVFLVWEVPGVGSFTVLIARRPSYLNYN